MTLSEYCKLKNQIVLSLGHCKEHNEILNALKCMFKDTINSPRRYEQITTMGELLRVLEIRYVISEDNIEPLEQIARKIPNNSELIQCIREYGMSHEPVKLVNIYNAFENTTTTPNRNPNDSFIINNSCMSNNKMQKIIDAINSDIGSFWKDLARNLDIKERDIDNINVNYKKVELKSKAVTDLFLNNSDPQTWFHDICEALDSSRRRDLVKKIKKISFMNI